MYEFETDRYIVQVAHRDGYKLGELARNMKDGHWLKRHSYCQDFENLMGQEAILPTPISKNRKFHFFTILIELDRPDNRFLEELSEKNFLYQLYGITTGSFHSNIPFETEQSEDLPFQCLI